MSELDDKTIYVFVRGDLAEEQQLVQAAHAVFAMARSQVLKAAEGEPRIVVLDGGSSQKAFMKTLGRISKAIILHTLYTDPDTPELGPTAIATAPLTKEQALPLANYRLRRYSPPSVSSAEVALDGQRGASFVTATQAGRTMCTAEATGVWPCNASVAQETEHSVSNREVAGEIPAGSSSS